MQANLGAKNHATVMMNSADRISTIKAIVGAAFGAAGQRCMALSVVILVGDTKDANSWIEEMAGEAKKLRVGNGFVDGVDVGECVLKLHLVDHFHLFYSRLHLYCGLLNTHRTLDQ